MNKLLKRFVIILLLIPIVVSAEPEKKDDNKEITFIGITNITGDTNEKDSTYSSIIGSQNAILVSGGTSKLENPLITKSGEANGEEADFYGTNAAVLVYNNATLDIVNGEINTDGEYSNALFAYGEGVINVSGTIINTTSNHSGGLMVTGGGMITASNCTVNTLGNSSAAIRSDRGGGTLIVNGGTYETSGKGSPAVYSTANIIVNNATLTSTSAEGLVIEGANSIVLNNVKLTDTNNTLNGNSETYKNIFLYQSMSGDAEEGISYFNAKDSSIITNKGDTIFVTNTISDITLENNEIVNTDGDFLRIEAGKWGNANENGGHVTLNLFNQQVDGDIIVDNISDLSLNMNKKSILTGSINNKNEANKISIKLSSDSILSLTGDTYINLLENEQEDNSNIYSNGKYKLFVNGEEVNINSSKYNFSELIDDINEDIISRENNNKNNLYYIIGGSVLLLVVFIIVKIKRND